jgi:ABC-type transporter Mla subunit MlaD
MNIRAHDFKLGLFILAGLAILAAGILGFGASHYFEKTTLQETYVEGNVDGLAVGAPVTLRGVRVGKVTRIDFTWNTYPQAEPRYVLIEFEIRNSIARELPGKGQVELLQAEVNQGLRARVKASGFLGSSYLSLEYVDPRNHPGLAVPWRPHNAYIPSAPSQLSELFVSAEQTLHNLSQIDLQRIGRQVERDLDAGERLINHVDAVDFAGIGTNTHALVTDLRELSSRAHSFVDDVDSTLKAMKLEGVSGKADVLLGQLQSAAKRLDSILANLDTGSLNATLATVRRASSELEDVLRELKAYPSGFLFGAQPHQARSLDRPGKGNGP